MFDFTTRDELFEAVFGCDYDVNGHTVDPSIVPPNGTIELISDDMEVAQIECDLDGNIIAFDYYCH